MKYDFPKVMRAHSDADLLEIVTHERENYQPDALVAAEAELARRNLEAPKLKRAEKQIARKVAARQERADEPLGDGWKGLLVLCPGVLALLIAGALKADGYHRKHREMWRYTLYGFVGYSLLVLIIALANVVIRMAR